MISDLDNSAEFICNKAFDKKTLDVCDENTLRYAALYGELKKKKNSLDKLEYIVPSFISSEENGVINIREILLYEGERFANMAYMCILGRVPERAALISLSAALSADSSREAKTKLLEAMANSDEAKQRGIVLTGFDNIDINEFYRYHDREFIENAYIRILLRRPDPEGENNFLSLLRSDKYSPVEILFMLRHSPEGEQHSVEIAGLDAAYRKRMRRKKLMNIPVIGRCGRYVWNLFGANRRINELRNENYRLLDKLNSGRFVFDEEINKVNSQLTQRINAVDGRTAELIQQNIGLDGKLSKLTEQSEATEERLTGLEEKSKTAEERLTGLEKESKAAEERLTGLEGLSETMESSLRELDTFTHQIGDNVNSLNSITENHEKILGEQSASITQLAKDADNRTASFENSFRELDGYTHQIGDNVSELNKASEAYSKSLSEQSDAVARLSEEIDRRSVSYENSIRELDGYTHNIGSNVSDINKALANYDGILSEYVNDDKKTIQLLLAEVFSLKSRINALEKGTAGTAEKTSSDTAADHTHAVPSANVYSSIDYFDFENHFRGSREHIKSVQKVYLPYFEGREKVLDLGCGRGEFTELLTENHVGVTGVDQYEPYVEYMKSLGLPAVLDDAVAYLSRQESTDGIFLGQVVEHISVDQIVTICNMAYEKLEKGSCLIMETPNPRSLAIYTECFYMDPSHQKPVHPFTLKYIAEKAGFSQVDILYTDSSRLPFSIPKLKENEPDFEEFNKAMQRLSELLYGSQDYAVIARK